MSPAFLAADEQEASVYGAFLAGRYAGSARDTDASARFYGDALALDPESDFLSERAFYAALLAGDFDLADASAATAAEAPDSPQLAQIYAVAADLADGRVNALLAETPEEFGAFGSLLDEILDQWGLIARGRRAEAEAAASELDTPLAASGHVLVHRALIFEAAGRMDRAEDAYRAAAGSLDMEAFTTLLLGEFLERRGRRAEAAALYEQELERADHEDAALLDALERVRARRRAPRMPDAPEAAARALLAPSAMLAGSAPVEYTALYLRLIQRLDPEFDRNTLHLAGVLEELEMTDAALAAYGRLADGPFAQRAAVDAAWLEFRLGNREVAMARAATLTETTDARAPRLLLADLHRLSGQCETAADIYADVIDARREAGEPVDWRYYFYEGVCRQTAGDWDAAEALFLQALDVAPDEPRILNHLGYNWIVLEENAERGFEMVARAAELAPDNGAILDSLGWGHFKEGRHDEAVRWLEDAVERSPADPTINWHLGDAYAAVGRSLEARFQWRRALELDPDSRERALIERRLEQGLAAGPRDIR
ncbi:tetratricopeptide repeat protein [Marinicauda salina]|nr:tetratricopeptide repeat protein [Marinicauda salina]